VVHPTKQGEKQFTVKTDYLWGKHSFVFRYFLTTSTIPGINPQNVNDQRFELGPLAGCDDRSQLCERGTVNEARFTFQRNSYNVFTGLPVSFKQLGANVLKARIRSLSYASRRVFTIGGGSFNGFPRQAFTVSDRLSVIRGKHGISLGGELSRLRPTSARTTFNLGSPSGLLFLLSFLSLVEIP